MSRTIITLKSSIIVALTAGGGANIILDNTAFTAQLTAEIDGQAAYSALVDFWHVTAGQSKYPFPIYAIDETSGKYQFGYDGTSYNSWKFKDLTSKKNFKSAGFRQYNTDGTVAEEWQGVSTPPGAILDTDAPYYILASTDAPTAFTFAGPINEPVQVYGDSTHGSFNKRTYLSIFDRTQGYSFAASDLTSVSRVNTGPYAQAFPLSSAADQNITHNDSVVNAAPYISLVYKVYSANQSRTIGSSSYNFKQIFDNTTANLTRFQIYERAQWLLRQTGNINSLTTPAVTGQTAAQICYFVGSTLYTNAFIDGLLGDDINSVVFLDATSIARQFPYAASGTFNFNAVIQATSGAKYTAYFVNPSATVGDEFGTTGAVVVNDKNGNPITANVSGSASVSWTFDYDGNVQSGRTAATDASCAIVVTGPGGMKYDRVPFTILRANGQAVSIAGLQDPVYVA